MRLCSGFDMRESRLSLENTGRSHSRRVLDCRVPGAFRVGKLSSYLSNMKYGLRSKCQHVPDFIKRSSLTVLPAKGNLGKTTLGISKRQFPAAEVRLTWPCSVGVFFIRVGCVNCISPRRLTQFYCSYQPNHSMHRLSICLDRRPYRSTYPKLSVRAHSRSCSRTRR
jgi:hypothetical protein